MSLITPALTLAAQDEEAELMHMMGKDMQILTIHTVHTIHITHMQRHQPMITRGAKKLAAEAVVGGRLLNLLKLHSVAKKLAAEAAAGDLLGIHPSPHLRGLWLQTLTR